MTNHQSEAQPCQGKNCGACDSIHSLECFFETAELQGWQLTKAEILDAHQRVVQKLALEGLTAESERLGLDEGPARPDLLERLAYHQTERSDLAIEDCLSYLAEGWRKVVGRTERQMVLQLLSLLASQPTTATASADATGGHASRSIEAIPGEVLKSYLVLSAKQWPLSPNNVRQLKELLAWFAKTHGIDAALAGRKVRG